MDFKANWLELNQLLNESLTPNECLAEVARLLKLYQILCKEEAKLLHQPEPEVSDQEDNLLDNTLDHKHPDPEPESYMAIGQRVHAGLKAAWEMMSGDKLENVSLESTKKDFEEAASKIPDEVKDLFKIHVQTSKSGNVNGKATLDSNLTNYGLVKLITDNHQRYLGSTRGSPGGKVENHQILGVRKPKFQSSKIPPGSREHPSHHPALPGLLSSER